MTATLRERLDDIRTTVKQHIDLYKSIYADPRTPVVAKVLLWMAISYLLLPIDIIPDFIPIIGQLDDAFIVPLLLLIAIKLVPNEVYTEHFAKLRS